VAVVDAQYIVLETRDDHLKTVGAQINGRDNPGIWYRRFRLVCRICQDSYSVMVVFLYPEHGAVDQLYNYITGMTTHRTLLLLRHAKSDWSAGATDDFSRPLSRRGCKDSPGMEALLLYLAGNELQTPKDGKYLPTATLAQLLVSGNWHNLRAGSASLAGIMQPRNLPK
jgi:hypothetical protein